MTETPKALLTTIAEYLSMIKQKGISSNVELDTIYLTNNIRIESREDGIWIVEGENETLLYDKDRCITTVNRANYAESAERAYKDGEGRPIKGIDIQEYGDNSYAYVILYDGQAGNYGVVDGSLEADLPDECFLGYTSTLYFTTPDYVDENYFSTNQTVYFKGDNTNSGVFEPEADTRYTIKFEYDGVNIVGYVSGVPA